jgi:hypothetical protein
MLNKVFMMTRDGVKVRRGGQGMCGSYPGVPAPPGMMRLHAGSPVSGKIEKRDIAESEGTVQKLIGKCLKRQKHPSFQNDYFFFFFATFFFAAFFFATIIFSPPFFHQCFAKK